MTALLEVQHVTKIYALTNGTTVAALQDITFTAAEGEFISIIGPSGCGKSTLVRLLAGLIEPSRGIILEHGKPLHGSAGDRGVVFQQYNLFPWLTVHDNIAFGLVLSGIQPREREKIISHYIEVMALQGFEHAYPKELSGGMQQRVSLARTFATNPRVLLMDEPFTALDVQAKRFMQDLLLQIWQKEPRTIIFVTHDVEEAVFLSDKVYIMSARPGTIREKISVNLPRPRNMQTEFSQEFIAMKKHVQEVITKESLGLTKLDLEIYKQL